MRYNEKIKTRIYKETPWNIIRRGTKEFRQENLQFRENALHLQCIPFCYWGDQVAHLHAGGIFYAFGCIIQVPSRVER